MNSLNEKEDPIKIDLKDLKTSNNIQYLSSFIKTIANIKSVSIGKLFLENFKSIIFKNAEWLIENEVNVSIFAFQNKMMLFEKGVNSLTIMDDKFSVIGT